MQPRFLFRHLNRPLLLLALRLAGVSASGEPAAGETETEERFSPGTVGALLGGDWRSRSEAEADCCELETAPLPRPLLPPLGLDGEDRRTESFRTLSWFFLFSGRRTEWVDGRLTLVFRSGSTWTFLRPLGSFRTSHLKYFMKAGSGFTFFGSLETETLEIT